MNTTKYAIPVLALIAVSVIVPHAYAATVIPQLEKIPEQVDFANNVDAKLLNNANMDKTTLQNFWNKTIYSFIGASFGLPLPHPSDPDNRDQTEYLNAAQTGYCDYNGDPEDAVPLCKHLIASARANYAAFQFFDLFTVHYMDGASTHVITDKDVFHERTHACSDIQSQIDIMWGDDFDFDDPDHVYDKMIRDGFIGKRVQDIENNLSAQYKTEMKDHANHNTFAHFYNTDENGDPVIIRTHPNGVVGCDLG